MANVNVSSASSNGQPTASKTGENDSVNDELLTSSADIAVNLATRERGLLDSATIAELEQWLAETNKP
jgi:hypothetical protein